MRTGSRRRRERGFAYVLLLVSVAVLGAASAAVVALGSSMSRRSAEAELLRIGTEFEAALRSYAGISARSALLTGPRDLEELLNDPRAPATRRHLRKVYADPLTGQPNWGLVRNAAGQVIAVYSQAAGEPIQQQGFNPEFAHLAGARTYQGWVFGLCAPAALHTPAGPVGPRPACP